MARDEILKSWPFPMVGHPLFAVAAQCISYGVVWALVNDWQYALALWLGIRVFALWVNLVQNYWTHDRRFGTRRYDDPGDNAMNISEHLPVIATFSACLQNNHHHYPHLLRLSHAADEFDFGFMTVRAMAALGLVRPSKTGTALPADLARLDVSL
jgi:fatty-acid desaturase